MAWCRKSGAQVAGKLENSTAIVAADGEKSARIDLKYDLEVLRSSIR